VNDWRGEAFFYYFLFILFLRVHILRGRRRQIDALHSAKIRDNGRQLKWDMVCPKEDRQCGFFTISNMIRALMQYELLKLLLLYPLHSNIFLS
jgi:hypothetical protein